MKIKRIILAVFLLALPPFISYMVNIAFSQAYINNNTQLQDILFSVFVVWQYIHYPYWLIVGGVFYHLSKNNNLNILLFLMPIVSLSLIYGGVTVLFSDQLLMHPVYTVSQLYVSGFTGLTSMILVKVTQVLTSTTVVLTAYVVNVLVFLIGYFNCNRFIKFMSRDNTREVDRI